MSRALLLKRSLLSYPGGNPGFDPSHIASPFAKISVVAMGAGCNALLAGNPTKPTSVVGSPTVGIGSSGPYVKGSGTGGTAAYYVFSNASPMPVNYGNNATLAAIVSLSSITTGVTGAWGTSANGANGLTLLVGSTGLLTMGVNGLGTFSSMTIQLQANVPYFLAASVIGLAAGAGTISYIAVNLLTGQIQFTTRTGQSSGPLSNPGTGTGAAFGAYANDTGVSRNVMAGMASAQYMPPAALLEWAQDPWSFWYPRTLDLSMMLTQASSGSFYTVSASEGTYTLTGEAQALTISRSVSASEGSYTLSGRTQSFLRAINLSASEGSYSLSGKNLTLAKAISVSASHGSYTLTGKTQTFLKGIGLSALEGTYSLGGNSVILTTTGSVSYVIFTQEGTYALSGEGVILSYVLGNPFVGGKSTWQKGLEEKYKKNPPQKNPAPLRSEVQKAAAHMSSLGGHARAKSLTATQRTNIATKAAVTRWR